MKWRHGTIGASMGPCHKTFALSLVSMGQHNDITFGTLKSLNTHPPFFCQEQMDTHSDPKERNMRLSNTNKLQTKVGCNFVFNPVVPGRESSFEEGENRKEGAAYGADNSY